MVIYENIIKGNCRNLFAYIAAVQFTFQYSRILLLCKHSIFYYILRFSISKGYMGDCRFYIFPFFPSLKHRVIPTYSPASCFLRYFYYTWVNAWKETVSYNSLHSHTYHILFIYPMMPDIHLIWWYWGLNQAIIPISKCTFLFWLCTLWPKLLCSLLK